jgi:hypothetical protein
LREQTTVSTHYLGIDLGVDSGRLPPRVYEPKTTDRWDEAYERLLAAKRSNPDAAP